MLNSGIYSLHATRVTSLWLPLKPVFASNLIYKPYTSIERRTADPSKRKAHNPSKRKWKRPRWTRGRLNSSAYAVSQPSIAVSSLLFHIAREIYSDTVIKRFGCFPRFSVLLIYISGLSKLNNVKNGGGNNYLLNSQPHCEPASDRRRETPQQGTGKSTSRHTTSMTMPCKPLPHRI